MPKYLIIDSNLLRGVVLNDRGEIQENGVEIIQVIDQLIAEHGYEVILYSDDGKYSQKRLLRELENKGLPLTVKAIAGFDNSGYVSEEPEIKFVSDDNYYQISWGGVPGKGSLIFALEEMQELGFSHEQRKDHIFFSGKNDLELLGGLGYQTFPCVNEGSFYDALNQVLENAKKPSKKKEPVNDERYSSAIQALRAYTTDASKKYNFWTKINHKRNVEIAKKLLENLENGNVSKDTVFKSKCTPWHHTIRSKTLKGIFQETEAQYKADHPQKSRFDCFK